MSEHVLRRDVDAIQADIASLKTDLATTLQDLVDAGRTQGSEARERLEAAVRARIDRLNDAAQRLGERGERVAANARKTIEDRPFESVAVAFGVGLLIGAILRR